MQHAVAGVEGHAVDVGIVDRAAARANEISRRVIESGTRDEGITRRSISNVFVTGKQLHWPVGIFYQQHSAHIVGQRRRQYLGKDSWKRIPSQRDRNGVLDVAADDVE